MTADRVTRRGADVSRLPPARRWAAPACSLFLTLWVFASPCATALAAAEGDGGAQRETRGGIELVRIPGGEFDMGSNEGGDNELPVHRVRVSAFWLGKTEVTVGQFRRFVEATGFRTDAEKEGSCWAVDSAGAWGKHGGKSWRDPGFPQGDDHPVVCVSWNDARAFADWAGLRLPTEAEWEYAAGNGARHTKYAWGDANPAGRRGGNVADESAKRRWRGWQTFAGYDDGYQTTAPVCSFEPNDFGLCDMTGNAWEWVSDWYGDAYYAGSPRDDPSGPASGTERVYRGGSWFGPPRFGRVAYRGRNVPGARLVNIGFRLASSSGPP